MMGLKILSILLSNGATRMTATGPIATRASSSAELVGVVPGPTASTTGVVLWATGANSSAARSGIATRFAEQIAVLREVDEPEVKFGFTGKHHGEFKDDILLGNVRWLVFRLRRVTDADLATGLRASGARQHEIVHFTGSLRGRINSLERVAKIHRQLMNPS